MENNKFSIQNRILNINVYRIFLIAIYLSQFSMIPWIINNVVNWSDLNFNDLKISYLAIISILIFIFYTPFLTKLAKNELRFIAIIKLLSKILLPVIIIIQLILDLLFYFLTNRIILMESIFSTELKVLISGWLSNERAPVILSILWIFISFGILIPIIITILYKFPENNINIKNELKSTHKNLKLEYHFGSIIFGLYMIFKSNGLWSLPLAHFIFCLFISPIIIYIPIFNKIDYSNSTSKSNTYEIFNIKLISGCCLLLIFYFVITIDLYQFENSFTNFYVWFPFIIGNLILIKFKSNRIRKRFLIGIWIMTIASLILVDAVSLKESIIMFYGVSSSIAMFGISFFIELLTKLKLNKQKLKSPLSFRLFCWMLSILLGLVLSPFINIMDPLSTYISFIIFLLIGIIILIDLLQNNR